MSSILPLRARIRALFVVLFCLAFLGLASWWAASQRATSRASHAARFQPDKGGLTPAGNTITVNSTLDVSNSTDGLCILREAITAANTDVSSGSVAGECAAGSSSGPDIVDLTGVTGTINLNQSLQLIQFGMHIKGPGASSLTVKPAGSGNTFSVFVVQVRNSETYTFSGLTMTNGHNNISGSGGGLEAFGNAPNATLNVNDCVLTGNSAGRGAAIENQISGTVNIVNTTITNNSTVGNTPGTTPAGGAAIANQFGTINIINSTIDSNSTPSPGVGAIYNAANGTIAITNSTITNNNASTDGGGIYNDGGTVDMNNCTVARNTAGNHGGGVYNIGVFRTRNSIIALNTAGIGPDFNPSITTQGHNLIGQDDSGLVPGSGDLIGTNASPIDPLLGVLQDNGGPTRTLALLSGSPALDAGDNCVTQAAHCGDAKVTQLTTDQRGPGFSRLVDGPDVDTTATVDMGAYEAPIPLANIPDQVTNEDTQLQFAFGVDDPGSVTSVTATSGNTLLVPNDSGHLSVNATGSSALVTINPAMNMSGTANITITINRSAGGPDIKIFILTVNSVNDVPSFTKGADQVVNEDAGAQAVNNWATAISAGPADESGQTVSFSITNNTNTSLFSAGPAVNSTGTLSYTPAANANGSATITINVQDNGGTLNGGVDTSAAQTFTITVNAINDAPSFTKGADQTVNEDAGAQTVTNWATSISPGPNEAGQTVTFTATNDNNALFTTQPAISPTGTMSYTPAANANGTATVTVTLKDNGGTANGGLDTSAPQTFTITVNSVNDAPSFTKGPNQTVNEDAGAQTANNWATSVSTGPANESGQTVSFNITNNTNAALFSAAPAVSPTGTLTYTPAANANGSATITINVQDNGGTANGGEDTSASQTFTITVNAVNDAPSFTKGADQTVNEDAGAQTVPNWATSISPGPNEAGQTVTFTATNDNNALFTTQPAISPTGTMSYTPAANANGTTTVTVTLKDNGGTTNGGLDTSAPQTFTITVNSVNDAPSFTKGPNQTVNEDAGAQTVNNWATSISTGPANESGQTVSFNITNNTNAALFSAAPAVSSTGTLTYTPAANANGSATITINVQDNGGTANGGVDTSAAQTFTITVNAVNDTPSFTRGADQTVNNNAGAQTVPNWATAIAAGPANESGQTLTFQITNNTNSSLFSAGPTVSPAGTLAYVPASNAGGTATITIRLQDNGGTANGGADTSPSQTFTITVTPVGGFINFSSATNNTTESSGFTTVTVKRTGDLTRAVTVDYASSADNGLPCSTANGVATPKCDFTAALGTLSFAAGEDTKVVNILISQDGFVEGPETFTVALSNPTNNAALGTTATSTTTIADDATEPAPPANVIDDARNFVRQHYHDFLNREPDQSGWDFWTNQITSCGSDAQCTEVRRIDVSASFFLSIEFQQTGYLVERFYKVGYADATGNSTFGNPHTLAVPIVRANEFLKDTQRIGQGVVVLAPGWEQALENNKQAYALEFIQTGRFTAALPTTMTPAQFVTRLNQNAGGVLTLTEQQTAINLFGGAGNTTNQTARAQAVRMVAEDQDLYNAEFNRAFVLAQYFGYLRRNPNDAPDNDYTGYDFWLTKLNQFNGNYIQAEMVKAFLSSIEYRQRFGP